MSEQLRPCSVKMDAIVDKAMGPSWALYPQYEDSIKRGDWVPARFHCWAGLSEYPMGLVELSTGQMACFPYEAIRFP